MSAVSSASRRAVATPRRASRRARFATSRRQASEQNPDGRPGRRRSSSNDRQQPAQTSSRVGRLAERRRRYARFRAGQERPHLRASDRRPASDRPQRQTRVEVEPSSTASDDASETAAGRPGRTRNPFKGSSGNRQCVRECRPRSGVGRAPYGLGVAAPPLDRRRSLQRIGRVDRHATTPPFAARCSASSRRTRAIDQRDRRGWGDGVEVGGAEGRSAERVATVVHGRSADERRGELGSLATRDHEQLVDGARAAARSAASGLGDGRGSGLGVGLAGGDGRGGPCRGGPTARGSGSRGPAPRARAGGHGVASSSARRVVRQARIV